jgi:hypothetical protein
MVRTARGGANEFKVSALKMDQRDEIWRCSTLTRRLESCAAASTAPATTAVNHRRSMAAIRSSSRGRPSPSSLYWSLSTETTDDKEPFGHRTARHLSHDR